MPAALSPFISAGLISASEMLVILTLPLMVRRTCGSATDIAVKLAVVGQFDPPVGLRAAVIQAGVEGQRIEGDRQRVALHLLHHLDAVAGQRDFRLRQRAARLPADVSPAGEHAAQGGVRAEERLDHRRVEPVEHHAGPPLWPASMVLGTHSSAFGFCQQCGPTLIFCSVFR